MKSVIISLFNIFSLLAPGLLFFAFAMGIRGLFQEWKASKAEKEKSAAGLQPRDATGKGGNLNQ